MNRNYSQHFLQFVFLRCLVILSRCEWHFGNGDTLGFVALECHLQLRVDGRVRGGYVGHTWRRLAAKGLVTGFHFTYRSRKSRIRGFRKASPLLFLSMFLFKHGDGHPLVTTPTTLPLASTTFAPSEQGQPHTDRTHGSQTSNRSAVGKESNPFPLHQTFIVHLCHNHFGAREVSRFASSFCYNLYL